MLTIFILCENPLFARGLERLLEQREEVNVVGVGVRGKRALARIKSLQPDVIILEAGKRMPKPWYLVSRLLKEQPQARVVGVSLADNNAALYTGCRWSADEPEDLIRGILAPTTVPSQYGSPSAGSGAGG